MSLQFSFNKVDQNLSRNWRRKTGKGTNTQEKVLSFVWGKGVLIALSTRTVFFLRKILRKKKHLILLALPFVSADGQGSAYIGSQASEHQEQGETGILITTMTMMTKMTKITIITMRTTITMMTMITMITMMMIAMMVMMMSPEDKQSKEGEVERREQTPPVVTSWNFFILIVKRAVLQKWID